MRTLITGGVKSGKSTFALAAAEGFAPGEKTFLATAIPFDDEMRARIARHKAERNDRFLTIEEPIDIHTVLAERMVVDCLTMWVNNLLFRDEEARFAGILSAFIERLPRDIAIVTNEVGLGNIPPDPVSRKYNLMLAEANTRVAAACDSVVFMVSGIPLVVKGRLS
jgi:adenosylcobinamide kinase / adenosylcobinamide-phosphate guanylyltransferase